MSKKKDPCHGCGFLNEYGACECPSYDKWYACPIESEKPENRKKLEDMAAEWAEQEYEKHREEVARWIWMN